MPNISKQNKTNLGLKRPIDGSKTTKDSKKKMAALVVQQEELLADIVRLFPVLYDKLEQGYKEKDVILNVWDKVAEQLDFIENGTKAQSLFNVLRKKYLRKRKDLKDSRKSATSADAVEKAERQYRPYSFLSWLDKYVQVREGRTSLPKHGSQEEEEMEANGEVEEPNDSLEEPLHKSGKMAGKKRPFVSQSSKDAYMNDMDFSLINSLREFIADRQKKASQKENNADYLFSKVLASELKDLPNMAKCMAKNEIMNVVFKYQMSVLRNQNDCNPSLPVQPQQENPQQENPRLSSSQLSDSPPSL